MQNYKKMHEYPIISYKNLHEKSPIPYINLHECFNRRFCTSILTRVILPSIYIFQGIKGKRKKIFKNLECLGFMLTFAEGMWMKRILYVT